MLNPYPYVAFFFLIDITHYFLLITYYLLLKKAVEQIPYRLIID